MTAKKPVPIVLMGNETSYQPYHTALLDILGAHKRLGESAVETFRRLATNEALAKTHGHQAAAAKLLGVSARVMNYWCCDLRLRPKDRKKKGTNVDSNS